MTTALLASTASAMVSSAESDIGPTREDPVSSLHTSMPCSCNRADGTQDIAVHSDADGESSTSCSAAPPISILTTRTQIVEGSFPSPAAAVAVAAVVVVLKARDSYAALPAESRTCSGLTNLSTAQLRPTVTAAEFLVMRNSDWS